MTEHGLDFDLLSNRIHPAESRITKLAAETPAAFVAFDLLALGAEDLCDAAVRAPARAARRRDHAERVGAPRAAHARPRRGRPVVRGVRGRGSRRPRREGRHRRVQARRPRLAQGEAPAHGRLRGRRIPRRTRTARASARCCSGSTATTGGSTTWASRRASRPSSAPSSPTTSSRYGSDALDGHPWADWAEMATESDGQRRPGAGNRWNATKDMSWEPVRIERVAEVAYEHMQGDRFRHTARFQRWRPDRTPDSCTYSSSTSPCRPPCSRSSGPDARGGRRRGTRASVQIARSGREVLAVRAARRRATTSDDRSAARVDASGTGARAISARGVEKVVW